MRSLALIVAVWASGGAASAQQPIPMSPELAKFMTTPDEERAVKANALRHWQALFPSCPGPSLMGVNVVVHVPPKFDTAGRPLSGTWQVVSRLQGCGQTRNLNVMYSIGANGQLTRTGTLPGSSAADPRLQRDGLMYASMAMVRIAPDGCKDYQYLDTAFEAFETSLTGTRPWTEKWTVRACGVEGVVRMHFTPHATSTTITANTAETVRVR